jgi:hypothetical protein
LDLSHVGWDRSPGGLRGSDDAAEDESELVSICIGNWLTGCSAECAGSTNGVQAHAALRGPIPIRRCSLSASAHDRGSHWSISYRTCVRMDRTGGL